MSRAPRTQYAVIGPTAALYLKHALERAGIGAAEIRRDVIMRQSTPGYARHAHELADAWDQLCCAASAGRDVGRDEAPISDDGSASGALTEMAAGSEHVMISTDQAGAILGVTAARVGQLIRAGSLPGGRQVGRSWQVPEREVRALADLRRPAA